MVGLSNVLLILVSLVGLTNGGFLEGLFKQSGNNSNSALGGAFGAGLGRGLLSGLFNGMKRAPTGEQVDPALASVLASFGKEFPGGKTDTSSGGTETEPGSPTTTAGSSGSQREPDSSEERNKVSSANTGSTGISQILPGQPASPTAGESASKKPVQPVPGQSGSEIPATPTQGGAETPNGAKPSTGTTGIAGNAGADVAKNVGAAAGAVIASSLLSVIMEAIKKKKEKRNKKLGGQEQVGPRREKRSLVGESGLVGSKGASKGLNNVPGMLFQGDR